MLLIPNPIPVTIRDIGQRIVDDCFPGDAAEKPVHFLTGGIEFAKLLVNSKLEGNCALDESRRPPVNSGVENIPFEPLEARAKMPELIAPDTVGLAA